MWGAGAGDRRAQAGLLDPAVVGVEGQLQRGMARPPAQPGSMGESAQIAGLASVDRLEQEEDAPLPGLCSQVAQTLPGAARPAVPPARRGPRDRRSARGCPPGAGEGRSAGRFPSGRRGPSGPAASGGTAPAPRAAGGAGIPRSPGRGLAGGRGEGAEAGIELLPEAVQEASGKPHAVESEAAGVPEPLEEGPSGQDLQPAGQSHRGSADVGAPGLDVDGVEGLAGGHEEAVALAPSEAEVGADLGAGGSGRSDPRRARRRGLRRKPPPPSTRRWPTGCRPHRCGCRPSRPRRLPRSPCGRTPGPGPAWPGRPPRRRRVSAWGPRRRCRPRRASRSRGRSTGRLGLARSSATLSSLPREGIDAVDGLLDVEGAPVPLVVHHAARSRGR